MRNPKTPAPRKFQNEEATKKYKGHLYGNSLPDSFIDVYSFKDRTTRASRGTGSMDEKTAPHPTHQEGPPYQK